MKRKFREANLVYYNPTILTEIMDEAGNDLNWTEMIENIELGHKEFKTLLALSEKADLSMKEIICLFLYYWEEFPEQEIANRVKVSQQTISLILGCAKEKLHPTLLESIGRNA